MANISRLSLSHYFLASQFTLNVALTLKMKSVNTSRLRDVTTKC